MSTGTKIFLAVFAAFVGVLVVYYGVLLPEAQTVPALSPATSEIRPPAATPGANDATGAGMVDLTSSAQNLMASNPGGIGPETGTFTSGGGFKFDLPSPPAAAAMAPVHSPPADPLSAQPPAAVPASPNAASNEPVQPITPVVSPPVANQPVSLPGTSKSQPPADQRSSSPQPPATTEYIVKSGDTMSSIAADWFGDANKWSLIAKENPTVDPAKLAVGQKLRLPSKDAKPAPVPATVKEQTGGSSATAYTVRSGDTLAKIAREYYGDVSKWKLIYDANKSVIGSDPAALKPGMKLKLPPK